MQMSQAPLSFKLKGAHLINAVLTIGYVLPLYFTKYTRLSFSKGQANNGLRSKNPSERWRDDPTVIKARLLSVSASMIASLLLMHYIVVSPGNATNVSRLSLGFLSFTRLHRACGIRLLAISGSLFEHTISLRTS